MGRLSTRKDKLIFTFGVLSFTLLSGFMTTNRQKEEPGTHTIFSSVARSVGRTKVLAVRQNKALPVQLFEHGDKFFNSSDQINSVNTSDVRADWKKTQIWHSTGNQDLMMQQQDTSINHPSIGVTTGKQDLHNFDGKADASVQLLRTPEFLNRQFPVHNPDLCKRVPSLHAVVLVNSRVTGFETRRSLRQLWFNPRLFKNPHIVVGYLVGSTNSSEIQTKLAREAEEHGDIIQSDHMESYRNCTIKIVAGLQWIAQYCSNTTYVIKIDDDTFLNIVPIMEYLESNPIDQMTIACHAFVNAKVNRNGKYKVSIEQWSEQRFPTFCYGPFYLFHKSLAYALLQKAMETPLRVDLEDVFITGIVAKNVGNVNHLGSNSTVAKWISGDMRPKAVYMNCSQRIEHYVMHGGRTKNYVDLWAAAIQRLPDPLKRKVNEDVIANTSRIFPGCPNSR